MFTKRAHDKGEAKKPDPCQDRIRDSVLFDNGFFPIGQCQPKDQQPKKEPQPQPNTMKG